MDALVESVKTYSFSVMRENGGTLSGSRLFLISFKLFPSMKTSLSDSKLDNSSSLYNAKDQQATLPRKHEEQQDSQITTIPTNIILP